MGNQRGYRTTPLINNLFSDPELEEKVDDGSGAKPLSLDASMRCEPKLYLLKLVEYNKIALWEKYGGALPNFVQSAVFEEEQQLAELRSCMTQLMRQSLI